MKPCILTFVAAVLSAANLLAQSSAANGRASNGTSTNGNSVGSGAATSTGGTGGSGSTGTGATTGTTTPVTAGTAGSTTGNTVGAATSPPVTITSPPATTTNPAVGTPNGNTPTTGGGSTTAAGAAKKPTTPPVVPPRNADNDWAALAILTAPIVSTVPTAGKTAGQHQNDHAAAVAKSRQAAQSAKDFYTQHPTDPRATEARKVEALAGLRGVQAGDPVQEARAVATAMAYRMNAANPGQDRLEVAIAQDRQDLSLKKLAGLVANEGEEEKKLVEKWRNELGDLPELETHAIKIARRSDPKTAIALASQVRKSPVATAAAKAEAQSLQNRALLLGHSLPLRVPLLDGGQLDLAQPRGKITIVVVWSPSDTDGLRPLEVFGKKGLPAKTQLVSLAVGGTTGEVMRSRHYLPPNTTQGHVAEGAAAKTAIATLRVHTLPYVYVLNQSGMVADFGSLGELTSLLKRAGVVHAKKK
jgi:hypothetical protein